MARRAIGITLVMAVIVALLPIPNRATGQPDEVLPPRVIDVSPPAGAELLPDDLLTIYFDQEMDRSSVEKALTIEPALSGAFSWTDAQTLNFKPSAPWQTGKTYRVTVGAGAAASSGAKLEAPYPFKVQTLSALAVATVAPAANATDVQNDSKIVVSFNRPILALGADTTQLPFTITPAVAGTGEWVSTSIYVFTPTAPLANDADYKITVAPNLKSVDGAILSEGYSWTFHTLPPQVLEIIYKSQEINDYVSGSKPNPQRVFQDTNFAFKFSEPVNRASVEAVLTLSLVTDESRTITGKFAWSDDSTQLTFSPLEVLKRDTDYRLRLALTRSSKGFDFKFHTLPYLAVESTYPKNGETYSSSGNIESIITFNVPIDEASLKEHVAISPTTPNMAVSVGQYANDVGIVSFPGKVGTTYTITLKAGLKDKWGIPTSSDYTFSFKVVEPPPTPSYVRPVINGDMMIFPEYRGVPQVGLIVPSQQTVDFGLYRWLPTALGDIPFTNHQIYSSRINSYSSGIRCKTHPTIKESNLVRKWSQAFEASRGDPLQAQTVMLSQDKLPLGLYWLTMGPEIECIANPYAETPADFVTEKGPQSQFGFAVVTANITLKRGPENAFVFLTNLTDAKPIPNATVTVYGDGKTIATGKTDSTGAALLPVHMQDHRFILITAEASGVFAAWYNYWHNGGWRMWSGQPASWDGGYDLFEPTSGAGYLYTDRPIYRPGDTVYFKGVLRAKRDMKFPVPEQRTAYIKIAQDFYAYYNRVYLDEKGQWLYQGKINLTEYGTFSGEYKIPPDAKLGEIAIWISQMDRQTGDNDYYVYSDISSDAFVNFTVAAYRAPEFELSLKANQDTIIQGDAIDLTARARYYFGGPVNEADVRWTTTSCPADFNYTGAGHYSFVMDTWAGYPSYTYYYYDNDPCYNWQRDLASGTARTGADGRAIIRSDETITRQNIPVQITVEATIVEDQAVSARTTILAHAASIYVGIGIDDYVGTINKSITANLITVTPDSQTKPNQVIKLSVERYDWSSSDNSRWKPVSGEKPIQITTDATGRASYRFAPQQSGTYRVVALVTDDKGREHNASVSIWVMDGSTASWYTHNPDVASLTLLTDKQRYRPGDTAELLIPVPYNEPSTVLLSVERAGVITHYVLNSKGNREPLLFKLPITDDFAPNVYINATYLRGVNSQNKRPAFTVSQSAHIFVEAVKPRLKVALKASQAQLKPGETVSFDLSVTDSDGKPVVAEVGLKLVDKAVLDLLPDNAGTLFDTFFRWQRLETYTDVSIDGLLEDVDTDTGSPPGRGGGGGGGGGGPGPSVRQNFKTTPLWSPHVVTDANGRASVSLTLPDNLTTFRLDARALTIGPDLKTGEATLDIVTSLPLLVRPVVPRFFVVGDEVELAAVVNNNTERDQNVRVSLQATGFQLKTSREQTVNVIAGGRMRVTWRGLVQDAPGADLTFTAIGEGGAQDAAKPSLTTGPNGTIPIYHYSATDAVAATSGVLRTTGTKTEAVVLPPRLNTGQGELLVSLQPSLASTLTGSFSYLHQYPHYCIEQTVSRFLPNVTTYKALRELYQNDPTLEANLKVQLNAAMDKLAKEQRSNGSWGWYPTSPIDPLTSAYATLGLIEAQKAGFPINTAMLDKAAEFVQTQMVAPLGLNDWQLNRQTFYLYVLARHGKSTLKDFEAVYDLRVRLSIASRAYLLLAFHERYPDHAAVKTLTSDLLSAATLSATGSHWEEKENDWYNWGTNTRTTALALTALLRTAPQSDLLPSVVRWLMSARQADHWPTTQETVWALTALSEWMVLTGELRGDYRYNVRFNSTTLASTAVKPLDSKEQTLRIAVKDLLRGTPNRLSISRGEGTGTLYYTAQFNMQLPAAQAPAVSRGISVKREYFRADNTKTPITSARIGDLITVRLTITTSQDVQYFALEDMFPAGTEAVDRTLLTTSSEATGTDIQTISANDPYWYWASWYFDHVELRDTQTNLYASYLPRGTYTYTYQVRASVPGKFQVMPTHAYTFYFSELFGRTSGILFTVLPEKGDSF